MLNEILAEYTFGKVLLIVFTLLAVYMFVKLSLVDFSGIKIFSLWQKVVAAVAFPLIIVAALFFGSMFVLGFLGFLVLTILMVFFWILFGKLRIKGL